MARRIFGKRSEQLNPGQLEFLMGQLDQPGQSPAFEEAVASEVIKPEKVSVSQNESFSFGLGKTGNTKRAANSGPFHIPKLVCLEFCPPTHKASADYQM